MRYCPALTLVKFICKAASIWPLAEKKWLKLLGHYVILRNSQTPSGSYNALKMGPTLANGREANWRMWLVEIFVGQTVYFFIIISLSWFVNVLQPPPTHTLYVGYIILLNMVFETNTKGIMLNVWCFLTYLFQTCFNVYCFQQLQKLKAENERLKAENRALTRVVSKLTNSANTTK
jgi:hypothetical protein